MFTDSLHISTTGSIKNERARYFTLEKGDRHLIKNKEKKMRVRCISGILWITQEGDIRDIILHPGDEFTINGKGVSLISSLSDSEFSSSRIQG